MECECELYGLACPTCGHLYTRRQAWASQKETESPTLFTVGQEPQRSKKAMSSGLSGTLKMDTLVGQLVLPYPKN